MKSNKELRLIAKIYLGLNKAVSLERLFHLTLEQLIYINHTTKRSSYLEACPGSGKTEVVGVKAAFEISKWESEYSGIAFLSFTRNSASEIAKRANQFTGGRATLYPHFIGTFDSWMHGYILHPFSWNLTNFVGVDKNKSVRIVDNDNQGDFLNAFTYTYYVQGVPNRIEANSYSISYLNRVESNDEAVTNQINSLTSQQRAELLRKKNQFFTSGFATYQDCEYLSCKVLIARPNIVRLISKRFPVIIIDECQDLSPIQLHILEVLKQYGSTIHLVGDMGQSIYEFRKVDPELIKEFIASKNLVRMKLSNNYRSNQTIVDLCGRLITGQGPISGKHPSITPSPCILWQYSEATFSQLPSRFQTLVENHSLDITNCAILARGKAVLNKFYAYGDAKPTIVVLLAISIKRWFTPNKTTHDLEHAFKLAGKALSQLVYGRACVSQNYYCPEGIDKIIWRKFIKDFLKSTGHLYPFKVGAADLTWTAWIQKLKTHLCAYWIKLPGDTKPWDEVKSKVRARNREGNKLVKTTVNDIIEKPKIRFSTIHSVKGETLSAVLLISASDRRSNGGHFDQWLNPGPEEQEYQRFAYVACSRPRNILVLATPQLTPAQLQQLTSLGFIEPNVGLPL